MIDSWPRLRSRESAELTRHRQTPANWTIANRQWPQQLHVGARAQLPSMEPAASSIGFVTHDREGGLS